jgi:PAS domain S-box-containing protein
MVSGRRGEQVVSLKGGEPCYRMLVEAMSEGAATLSRDGAVLYCNRRFAELMSQASWEELSELRCSRWLRKPSETDFDLLTEARRRLQKVNSTCVAQDGSLIPVYLSLNRFRGFNGQALGMVITDLSEQKRKQAAEINRPKRCTGSCWNARFRRKRRNGAGLRANCMTKPASC